MKLVRDAFRDAVRMPYGVDVAQEAGQRVEQAAGLVDGHSSFSSRTWRSIFSGGADEQPEPVDAGLEIVFAERRAPYANESETSRLYIEARRPTPAS